MRGVVAKFNFLFRSTKGLILVAIALIALATAFFGTLSGPLRAWGVTDLVVEIFGLRLVEAEREGRIVVLYHAIAIAVVAIETYIITAIVPMKQEEQSRVNGVITLGYLLTFFGGLAFAYFGHDFLFHGLYIFGLSLTFLAGLLLAAALWPWRKEFRASDSAYARWGDVSLERMAFFVMAIATLGSALFGAVPGAYWGNGHETFLAEDILRQPEKTGLQLAVIGHLHIMLTLIAVALALIVGRWLDFKGLLHKLAMPLFIVGTAVITLGVWAVVPFEPLAHTIIYGGSTVVLLGALLLVIYGFGKITRDRLAELGVERPTFGRRLRALLHDPLKFGALWQMVYMNFVVSFPGIFMAVNLEEIFRVWPLRLERVILTGHWHVLSGIIATIILLYYADLAGLQGRVRRLFGWSVILFSDLAVGAALIFLIRRLFVIESLEAPLVATTTLLMDVGLGVLLVGLAVLLGWRLIDLFKRRGRWREELSERREVLS